MIDIKIIQEVKIPVITEEVLASLVRAEIAKNHPEVNVTGIEFSSKLSPKRIEAAVTAQIGDSAPVVLEPVEATATEEVQEELVLEDPKEDAGIADIFNIPK